MIIVGITGKKRSGKDTAAQALVTRRNFVRVAFADALKELAFKVDPWVTANARLSDLVRRHGWEKAKDTFPEVRRLLHKLGTEGVRDTVGEDSWIRAWQRTIDNDIQGGGWDGVVVPDARFPNEVDEVEVLIRIERPGLLNLDTHASETEMDNFNPDITIVNDGTAEQLQARVLAAYDQWREST